MKNKKEYQDRYKSINHKLREREWQRIKEELTAQGFKEIMKDDKPTSYYVNMCGEVRNKWGREIAKNSRTPKNYCHALIRVNGEDWIPYKHQLVWWAFIGEIPNGYEIDHIDTNPMNNCLDNLRCVDPPTNRRNSNSIGHYKESNKGKNKGCAPRTVYQYTLDGELVASYPSVGEAERKTGINRQNIYNCCWGKRKSIGNYTFNY